MKLLQLEVENFRGIRSLLWKPHPGFNMLVGPGDSGKTAILDAIDYVLGPRWNLVLTDTDFSDAKTTKPILITATVGDLPKNVLGDPRFELDFRGWHNGEVHDEPYDENEDGEPDEPVLSIRLTISEDLEPIWRLYTERRPDEGPIFLSSDRDKLGVVRVGHYVDRHLNWGKGSALSQYTDDPDSLHPIFADVRRQSANAFRSQKGGLEKLNAASSKLQASAENYGVRIRQELLPGLESTSLTASGSSIGLYDGDIPARQMGLGSRRLLTITMQLSQDRLKSILLLDEIESALEPIRIRALIGNLMKDGLQVFASTHSPIALSEASSQTLWHVKWSEKATEPIELSNDAKSISVKSPQAILGDRSIVYEGKTESGFLKVAIKRWEEKHGRSISSLAICDVYAEGCTNCGPLVGELLDISGQVAVFADTDKPIHLNTKYESYHGFCDGRYSVPGIDSESAFLASIPESMFPVFLDTLKPHYTGLRNDLAEVFNLEDGQMNLDHPKFPGSLYDILRKLASEKKWLKHEFRAQTVLEVMWDSLIPGGPLTKSLSKIENWCYESVAK